jgi:hypothetical protein
MEKMSNQFFISKNLKYVFIFIFQFIFIWNCDRQIDFFFYKSVIWCLNLTNNKSGTRVPNFGFYSNDIKENNDWITYSYIAWDPFKLPTIKLPTIILPTIILPTGTFYRQSNYRQYTLPTGTLYRQYVLPTITIFTVTT